MKWHGEVFEYEQAMCVCVCICVYISYGVGLETDFCAFFALPG